MSSHQTDRHHFERQIVYARPIFILLALLAVLEQPPSRGAHRSASFLIAYLIAALLVTQIERLLRKRSWHLPLGLRSSRSGHLMYISPSTVPVWVSVHLFLCTPRCIRWGAGELTLPLARGALALILVLLTAVKGDIHWMRVVSWLGITPALLRVAQASPFWAIATAISRCNRVLFAHQRDHASGSRTGRIAAPVPRRIGEHL